MAAPQGETTTGGDNIMPSYNAWRPDEQNPYSSPEPWRIVGPREQAWSADQDQRGQYRDDALNWAGGVEEQDQEELRKQRALQDWKDLSNNPNATTVMWNRAGRGIDLPLEAPAIDPIDFLQPGAMAGRALGRKSVDWAITQPYRKAQVKAMTGIDLDHLVPTRTERVVGALQDAWGNTGQRIKQGVGDFTQRFEPDMAGAAARIDPAGRFVTAAPKNLLQEILTPYPSVRVLNVPKNPLSEAFVFQPTNTQGADALGKMFMPSKVGKRGLKGYYLPTATRGGGFGGHFAVGDDYSTFEHELAGHMNANMLRGTFVNRAPDLAPAVQEARAAFSSNLPQVSPDFSWVPRSLDVRFRKALGEVIDRPGIQNILSRPAYSKLPAALQGEEIFARTLGNGRGPIQLDAFDSPWFNQLEQFGQRYIPKGVKTMQDAPWYQYSVPNSITEAALQRGSRDPDIQALLNSNMSGGY